MNVFRVALALLLSLPFVALAESECEDPYLECKDDCLIEFGGSVKVDQKKKYEKCMKKCTKVANRCTERAMETKASGLDEGALDGTPTSQDVDKEGLPTKTASKKKKVAAEERADDTSGDDPPARPKEALTSDEVPKSNRTSLKVEDAPPPKQKDEARDEPKKEVIEMQLSPRQETNDSDLREDKPRTSSPPPKEERDEPAPPPKKEKKREEAPPPKKEDDDDLRNY